MRIILVAILFGLISAAAARAGVGAPAAGAGASADAGAAPRNVRIVRDHWGIAHIYGKSDADAVFGTMYAQAEDDFDRIERNYLVGLGMLARAEGEGAVYQDLRQRLFYGPEDLRAMYRGSPAWLKTLLVAWADGLNDFLSRHPAVRPKVIRRFEPWMALSFTEGSIGSDIESVDLGELQKFYAQPPRLPTANCRDAAPAHAPAAACQAAASYRTAATYQPAAPYHPAQREPGGSNGFAIAPSRSATGHALLWINPHTSYYFRSELQMVSDEGLNVYGA